jgi:calcineurin-like phosphoesterase family protein
VSVVYYWSDPHFGHTLVARLRGFQNAEQHDAYLIDRWQATVSKRDSVWILGDLAMSSPAAALGILKELPGTKHLILGNHDSAHPMHRRSHRQQYRYFEVFDSVQTMARHHLEGQEFMLSHFPYVGDHAGKEDRYTQYRLLDQGLPLIHGHVHGEWKVRGRQVNVGVDHWMDGPVSVPEILDVLEKGNP